MKTVVAFAFMLAVLAPAVAAQPAPSFTGKWEGTYTLQRPDGTEANPRPVAFSLTQQNKEITGTAGPADSPGKIEKGVVEAGKATFEMPQPDGSFFKFTLAIVKERLQGEMTGHGPDGALRGRATVDATKAK